LLLPFYLFHLFISVNRTFITNKCLFISLPVVPIQCFSDPAGSCGFFKRITPPYCRRRGAHQTRTFRRKERSWVVRTNLSKKAPNFECIRKLFALRR
uniref:Secreted protein n=1 Tax=Ascaris lumbricoides TaxID=6252 RepID=A0A0M3IQ21_ASCLU